MKTHFRIAYLSIALALFIPALKAQSPLTTISDTITYADGSHPSGVAIITWGQGLNDADPRSQIAAGQTTIGIMNGVVNISLFPNTVMFPPGSCYGIQYAWSTSGPPVTRYWYVPVSTAPVTLNQIESSIPCTSTASPIVAPAQINPGPAGQTTVLTSSNTGFVSWLPGGGGGGAPPFSQVMSGVNSGQTLAIGLNSTLSYQSNGTINANQVLGVSLSSLFGNTGKLTQGIGIFTSGDLASFDSSGNIQDSTIGVANLIQTGGSYANPSWITSLAGSKITGALACGSIPTFTGDASSSGCAVTVTKTSGVLFAPSATLDTTIASNILTGTLNALRLPAINLATSGPGGVTGNLQAINFNGGLNATAGYYWGGDMQFHTVIAGGTVTNMTGPLTAGSIVIGNGSNDLTVLSSHGTTGQVLTATTGGTPVWSLVTLPGGVSGILATANGGTGTAFFTVAGPSASAKTYTFPNANATILTSNAAVTMAQGGLGANFSSIALGGILSGSGAGALTITTLGTNGYVLTANSGSPGGVQWTTPTSGGTVTNIVFSAPLSGGTVTATGTIGCPTCNTSAASLATNQLLVGQGGQTLAGLGSLGTTSLYLQGNAAGPPSWSAIGLTSGVTGILPLANGGTGTGTVTASAVFSTNSGSVGSFSTTLPAGLTIGELAAPLQIAGASGQAGFAALVGNTSVPAAFPALSVSLFGPNAGSMSPYGIQLPASPGVTPGFLIGGATNLTVTFNGTTVITGANSFPIGAYLLFSAIVGPTNLTAPGYYVIATGLSSTQFEISAAYGGSPITVNASGTATVTSNIVPLSFATVLPFGIGLNLNGASLPTPQNGTILQLSSYNSSSAVPTNIELDSYGGTGSISCGRRDGSPAAPTPLQSTEQICGIAGFGSYDTSGTLSGAQVGIFFTVSGGAWTSISQPTAIDFDTTPTTGATKLERARITPNGEFDMPSTVTGSATFGAGWLNVAGGYAIAGTAWGPTVTNDFTAAQNINLGMIAGTGTDALQLFNTTPALVGAQVQISPSLHFRGSAWTTNGVGSSQIADWTINNDPVPGSGVNITSQLAFGEQINGGGYTNIFAVSNLGGIVLPTSVTGGFEGAGSINVSGGYYVNGVQASLPFAGTNCIYSNSSGGAAGCSTTLPAALTIPGFSLGAGPGAIAYLFTVGTGGVVQNTLVGLSTSNPSKVVAGAGFNAFGIAESTVAASGTVLVARDGIATCLADSGGMVAGDRVIPSTVTVTYCADSNQTSPVNIPITTRIIGQALTSVTGSGTFLVSLEPDHSGAQVSGGTGYTGVNAQTANYTSISGDSGKLITMTGTSLTYKVPASVPSSTWYGWIQNATTSTGALTINTNGLTINGSSSNFSLLPGQWTQIAANGAGYSASLPITAGIGILLTGSSSGLSITPDPSIVCFITSSTCLPPLTATGGASGSLASSTLTNVQFAAYANGQPFVLTITDANLTVGGTPATLTMNAGGGPINIAYIATPGALPVPITSGLLHQNIPYNLTYSATCNGVGQATACLIAEGLGVGSGTAYTPVSFSGTPAFPFTGAVQTFEITLTGNVTSSTVSGAAAGNLATFIICQDSTGSRTFTWPSGFRGALDIGSAASTCSSRSFVFDGTSYFASGVINQ